MVQAIRVGLLGAAVGWTLAAQTEVNLEATAWNTRLNEVRKPAVGGTTFSFGELLGNGPTWAPRLDARWQLNARHGLRVLLAPLEISGTGTFAAPVDYQGRRFRPGESTRGLYRFNSWRATWHYILREDAAWTLRLGATIKIRDAKVQLEQDGLVTSNHNLGVVPLVHLSAERRFAPGWSAVFETDALGARQGRAIDAALLVRWRATPRVQVDLGYRLLEGGAENDEIYTWARLDGWRLGVGMRL